MAGTRRLPNTQAHGPIALAASSYFAKVPGLPAGLEAWPCKTVLLVPFLAERWLLQLAAPSSPVQR